ncbi:MAG: O-antigen ligase family protein [Ktedonobacterales bacterium]
MMRGVRLPYARLSSKAATSAAIAASIILLSAVAGRLGPTPVLAVTGVLAGLCILGTLLYRHQDALVATISIGMGLLVDWYEFLPWPLGVRLPVAAGVVALAAVSYRFLTRSSKRQWAMPPLFALWLILAIIAAPAIPEGDLLSESIDYYLWFMIIPVLMYMLGMFIAEDTVQFRRLFTLLSTLGTLVALHTLLYVWTGVFILETAYARSNLQTHYNFLLQGTNMSRAGSFLLNPDSNGTFLAVILVLPLALCLQSSSWKARIFYGIETLLIGDALLATYSIGAMAGAAVGLLAFALCLPGARLRIVLIAIMCGAIVLFRALLPSQLDLLVQHASSGELAFRATIWQGTLHMIEANPITGIGLGQRTYMAEATVYRIPQEGTAVPTAHNSYLELAALAGLPVLGVYLTLLVATTWRAVRNVRRAEGWQRIMLAATIGAAVALTVNSTEGIGWTLGPVAWVAWILLGTASSPFLFQMLSTNSHLARARTRSTAQSATRDAVAPTPTPILPTASTPPDPALTSHSHTDPPTSTLIKRAGPVATALATTFARTRSMLADLRHVPAQHAAASGGSTAETRSADSPIAVLIGLVRSSGIYALASVSAPLVSIILAPYLAHHLSPSEYGVLTLVNTAITLMALLTQLGMNAAFLRAYNYDYSSRQDHHAVVATSLSIVAIVSLVAAVAIAATAPSLAYVLLHRSSLGSLIALAAAALLLQNLTVPGLAWLRAQNRSLVFSLLSAGSLAMTLAANLVLVGVLQLGVAGAVIATAAGYAVAAAFLVPTMAFSAGIRIRRDVAWNLLTFGIPHVPGFVSFWVLQLSDRYLLSLFAPLAQVASYAVSYTLGWAMATLLIGPFALAWPPTMYVIARRRDAANVYRIVFRAFSLALLFAALALSFVGSLLLDVLFPPSYHAAAPVIPLIASSSVLYGLYYVLMVGADLRRKAWLVALFMGACALINVLLNLILIPRYGALGAALSTLAAYAALAVMAYVGNQIIYPIPFEVGRFLTAGATGVCIYFGSLKLAHDVGHQWTWAVNILALAVYGGVLLVLAFGRWPWRSGNATVQGETRNSHEAIRE